jgi:hypothetical protein
MKKALTAVFALALLASAAAGCTDSSQDPRLGEKPRREQPPAASPPTDTGRMPGGSPAPTTPPPTR